MNIKKNSLIIDNIPVQVIKLGRLINYLPNLGLSGIIKFIGLKSIKEVPFVDGVIYGELPADFSTISIEVLHRRFVANFYNIPIQKHIEYYDKEPLWEEIDSFLIDIKELFLFLKESEFTGFVKIRNMINHSISFIFLESGMLVAAEKDGYKGKAVLIDIVDEMTNYHCKLSIYKVSHEYLSLYFSLYRHIYTTTDYNKVLDTIKNLDISAIQIITKDNVELVLDIFLNDYSPINEDIVFYEIYNIYRVATNIPKIDYKDIKDATKSLKKFEGSKEVAKIRFSCPVCCSTISMFYNVCPICGAVLTVA